MRYFILCVTVLFCSMFTFCYASIPYGGHSMVAPLKSVIVKRPDSSFAVDDTKQWHYVSTPHVAVAQQEHDALVQVLKNSGVEIIYHNDYYPELADSIYVHDPAIMTDFGAIILRMGKSLRRGEEQAIAEKFKQINVPIFYHLQAPATAEGGDILWLDEKTLAVGRSFRTNQAAIDQLKHKLKTKGIEVLSVALPYDQGREACLHLQSLISMIDNDLAVVYKKFLPVSFIEELEKRHITMLNVDDDEYLTMGPNILAIAPKKVLTIAGNPKIQSLLQQHGVQVHTYKGDELSLKAEGGATCLTRPVYRAVS